MLTRVVAAEHTKATPTGKTEPSFIVCETLDGTSFDVVAKFSDGCEQREKSLAREVVAACLAADLGLPVPEPFLVDISPEWAEAITDPHKRARVQASSPVAFGSRYVAKYSLWNTGITISEVVRPVAAAIFAFDAIIQNPDRRSSNPNCFVKGDDIRIFDHEMAFCHDLIIGWQPPWVVGGLKNLETPGSHIFSAGLKGKLIDYGPIKKAWGDLSDARISEYEDCIPNEWPDVVKAVRAATKLIRDARDRIDDCIEEINRVLK